MSKRTRKRIRLAVETTLLVAGLIAVKAIIRYFGLEVVELNPLYTSMIAGGIFLFGLILSGTLADYKESEKIPAEIVAACENILEEGIAVKKNHSSFQFDELRNTLMSILTAFKVDAVSSKSRLCLDAISKLPASFVEMERLAVPANYIVRLKSEASAIRRNMLRVYYIQRIGFLPSAFVLVESIVLFIIALMLITKFEHWYESIFLVGFVSYMFIYIRKLLHVLDNPFQAEGETMDDVSLFLLDEFETRLANCSVDSNA